MNRRRFLAASLRLPAALAVLPVLGGLATMAQEGEQEAMPATEIDTTVARAGSLSNLTDHVVYFGSGCFSMSLPANATLTWDEAGLRVVTP